MQVVKYTEMRFTKISLILIVSQFSCSDIEKRINVSPNQLENVSDIHEHVYAVSSYHPSSLKYVTVRSKCIYLRRDRVHRIVGDYFFFGS